MRKEGQLLTVVDSFIAMSRATELKTWVLNHWQVGELSYVSFTQIQNMVQRGKVLVELLLADCTLAMLSKPVLELAMKFPMKKKDRQEITCSYPTAKDLGVRAVGIEAVA